MACCYIAAFCIHQLVKTCQFLDIGERVYYNEDKVHSQGPGSDLLVDAPQTKKYDNNRASPAAIVLSLGGMTCTACTHAIEAAISALPGVGKVRVSLTLQQATVIAEENQTLNTDAVLQAVHDIGYDAQLGPRSPQQIVDFLQERGTTDRLKSTFFLMCRCAAILQTLSFCHAIPLPSASVSALVRSLIQVACMAVTLYIQVVPIAWIHVDGWKWLRGGSLNMNTLTSVSMGLASLLPCLDWLLAGRHDASSLHSTAVGLGLVIVAGKYVDSLSRRSASANLARIYKPILQVDFCTLYPEMKKVPSSYLRPGDKIVVEPHSVIVCDCYVLEGCSLVSESIVTGESVPVKKATGDFLLGGTRNLSGKLLCVVQREKDSSFYTKLVQSAAESSATTSGEHRLTDKVTTHFVAAVLMLATVAPIVYLCPNLGETNLYDLFHDWAIHAITILTCACPCAISLAIPSAIVAAIVTACSKGIIITGGINTMEKLELSKTIVFDKTGTLTHASLDVDGLLVIPEWEYRRPQLWELVCALESHAINHGHPVARAVFSAGLRELGTAWADTQHLRQCRNVVSEFGKGIRGDVQIGAQPWYRVDVGSLRFLRETGVKGIPHDLQFSGHIETTGTLLVYVSIDNRYVGTFLIADAIRQEAHDVIKRLIENGYECKMLTGDTKETALRVSKHLGLPVLQAQALPEEKKNHILSLQKSGRVVTMVGDGLNDLPSLATACVGVGLQKDTTYDVVGGAAVLLVNSRLDSVIDLYTIARMTMRQIRWNLAWIFTYNAFALVLSTRLFTPFNLTLTPSLAALLMSASSVFLTLQSFLLRKRLEKIGDGTPSFTAA